MEAFDNGLSLEEEARKVIIQLIELAETQMAPGFAGYDFRVLQAQAFLNRLETLDISWDHFASSTD